MCSLIAQCNSNYVAVRSLQINIIEDVSCGERNHNRCWYLHLYSVNIKSKHRWYPNISFGMLHCSIILSLSLSLSLSVSLPIHRKNMLTPLLLWDEMMTDSKSNISSSSIKNISWSKVEFYLRFVRRTGSVRYSGPSFSAYIIKRLSGIS